MVKQAALATDDQSLTAEEQAFLKRARGKYRDNADWLEFEEFAFGSRSPIFASTRSHRDVLQHPLYEALKEMWLDLGVRQGRIAASPKGEDVHAPRRTSSRRR
jgi:hypothetical protein